MSLRELLLVPASPTFGGVSRRYEECEWVLLGTPFDSTTTYRPGSRFAPRRVREISQEIDLVNPFIPELRYDRYPMCDLGDLVFTTDVNEFLRCYCRVLRELLCESKRVFVLGGEHTVTIGTARVLRELSREVWIVYFDAHLDLYDEYPRGCRISHATVVSRLLEYDCEVVAIGYRAYSEEEYRKLRELAFWISTSDIVRSEEKCLLELAQVLQFINGDVVISLDVDVLDPSIAPAVSNPEPGGLDYWTLLELLRIVLLSLGQKIKVIEVVEYTPVLDYNGITGCLAAKLISDLYLLALIGNRC